MAPSNELICLSRALGEPSKGLAILAEGNASQKIDEDSFWVKASGFSLATIEAEGFVRVRFAGINMALQKEDATDEEVRGLLAESRVDSTPLMPSVETFMHAYLLGLPGVEFVGHTHPTALLSLLSLHEARRIATLRLFPDEIVCCGPAAAFVDYVDPGLPLARAIRDATERFVAEHGSIPKTIWLQNHGLIVLGKSPREVESGTYMSEKAAQVWLGALSSGNPLKTLSPSEVARIQTRPDEHYRQRLLWQIKRDPVG